MTGLTPYRPRRFRSDGVWEIDGLSFKTHLISQIGKEAMPDALLTNAWEYTALMLPAIRKQEGLDHGLGYIILHAGEMGNWLLIHWWAYEDIALRMLASADVGKTQFKSEDHRRFHACVWEHVAIDHERNAWVETMMIRDGSPEAYLQASLAEGDY